MAVDTAPAAVPSPDEPSAARAGFLASVLTPVEPARPATALAMPTGSATSTAAPGDVPAGVSSAAFHETPDNTPENDANSGSGARQNSGARRQESVVRAWLLAGAERWKKGAGANIKRLEVQKARAAADAAAARKQPVNPMLKQSPGASSAGGRSSALKPSPAPKPGPMPKQPGGPAAKNTAPAPAPKTPAPRPAPAPKQTPPSPKTPAPAPAPAPKKQQDKTTTATNPAPAPKAPMPKPDHGTGKPSKDSKATSVGSASPSKSSGSTGKGSAGGSSRTADGKPKNTGLGKTSSDRPTDSRSSEKPTASQGEGKAKGPATASGSGSGPQVPGPRAHSDTKPGDGKSTAKTDLTKNPKITGSTDTKSTAPDTAETKPSPSSSTTPDPKPTTPRPLLTREARETGYRDGHRAGRATAKGRAYGHGFQDGWRSVMDTADDEKQALDRARDLRKEDRKEPTMTTAPSRPAPAIPPKPTEPPTVPAPAAPLKVAAVDATTIVLGPDADRASMTRGEVRTLKGFERRLTDHHGRVQAVAESTRGLGLHASLQAEQVTQLLEQAKGIKGGGKLLAKLARLQEAAQTQAALAQETHTRAVRGADATSAVLANVETRYSSIYQAVVDSDETEPAELTFYKG